MCHSSRWNVSCTPPAATYLYIVRPRKFARLNFHSRKYQHETWSPIALFCVTVFAWANRCANGVDPSRVSLILLLCNYSHSLPSNFLPSSPSTNSSMFAPAKTTVFLLMFSLCGNAKIATPCYTIDRRNEQLFFIAVSAWHFLRRIKMKMQMNQN